MKAKKQISSDRDDSRNSRCKSHGSLLRSPLDLVFLTNVNHDLVWNVGVAVVPF